MDAAQALPGAQLVVLALLQKCGKPARLKLGGIAHRHALCPVGKLGIVGAGQRCEQGQILPPPLLDGLALCGKLHVQHFQQGAFFCPRALRAACGMTQKRVFLLQCPHIATVGGKVAGVQLAQRRVQKPPPSFRCTFYKAQVPGVEHHSRKAARKARRPLGRRAVDRCIPAGALCIRRAHRNAHICRFVRFLILLPGALGDGLQYRECFSAAHKLGILAAPEAFAAGQQPDGLQQVRFALTVVAADHGQLPARFQLRCRNIAVIRNFQ